MKNRAQKEFAIVFTDMEGSSDYWRKLDSAFLQALAQHDDMLLKLTEKHGGS